MAPAPTSEYLALPREVRGTLPAVCRASLQLGATLRAWKVGMGRGSNPRCLRSRLGTARRAPGRGRERLAISRDAESCLHTPQARELACPSPEANASMGMAPGTARDSRRRARPTANDPRRQRGAATAARSGARGAVPQTPRWALAARDRRAPFAVRRLRLEARDARDCARSEERHV